jgi:hypothetical protein
MGNRKKKKKIHLLYMFKMENEREILYLLHTRKLNLLHSTDHFVV